MISEYKNWSSDRIDELLSNYLIDSWSFSRVGTFARNEKAFEMRYLYNVKGKSSATSVAGQAYHSALEWFYGKLANGEQADLIDMQLIATERINEVPAYEWKIQKTRPTVEKCIQDATSNAYKGIENFLKEQKTVTDEIKNVIGIELQIQEWLVVNGVSIPLPCNMYIDRVVETKDGKTVIIDDKLRTSFTSDEDISFVIGKQAITYVLGYEAKYGKTVDEVWFIENKISKNKDGSPQLKPTKVVMDNGTRRLYEAMLYEPLRRMLEAVSNPDYIYMMNDADNFEDKAEIYEFWAKTMLDEIEGFEIAENKKELIKKRQRKIKDSSLRNITPSVLKNFKKFAQEFIPLDFTNKDMTKQEKIEAVLRNFGLMVQVAHMFEGFSSDTFLLDVGAGVAINSVKRYRLDIANALGVSNIRINDNLTVHEGRSFLSLEAGKQNVSTLMWDKTRLKGMKIPIGVDNYGATVSWDLNDHSTPHMLVCGATGSGKSVSIKSTVMYAIEAGVKDIYIMDPKFEFTDMNGKNGISVINDIAEIETQMALLVVDMENRVRTGASHKTLIIFDEYADAIAQSRTGRDLNIYDNVMIGQYADGRPKFKREIVATDKSLSENMQIILQKGRSSGLRILAATQRASTDVIKGDAKVNFPVAVCFRVPKEVDSTVVLGETGAESLNGRGDGLIKSPKYKDVVRFQGFFYG